MTVEATTWLYVAVRKTGNDDQIVGQVDTANEIAYIPAFQDKETAQQALLHLQLEKRSKYEVQAIIFEDLSRYATEGGFLIFVLDAEGKVLHRLPA